MLARQIDFHIGVPNIILTVLRCLRTIHGRPGSALSFFNLFHKFLCLLRTVHPPSVCPFCDCNRLAVCRLELPLFPKRVVFFCDAVHILPHKLCIDVILSFLLYQPVLYRIPVKHLNILAKRIGNRNAGKAVLLFTYPLQLTVR